MSHEREGAHYQKEGNEDWRKKSINHNTADRRDLTTSTRGVCSERRCKGRGIKNETPAKFAEASKNLYLFTILRILRGETSVDRAVFELASYGCLFHITRKIFSIVCLWKAFDSQSNCSGSFKNSPLSFRAFTNSSTILSKISHMIGVMSYVCLLIAQIHCASFEDCWRKLI